MKPQGPNGGSQAKKVRTEGKKKKKGEEEEPKTLRSPIKIGGGKTGFRVSKIVGERVRHGKKEYFISWEGYAEEENTWEPANIIRQDCPLVVKEWHQMNSSGRKGRNESAQETRARGQKRPRDKTAEPSKVKKVHGPAPRDPRYDGVKIIGVGQFGKHKDELCFVMQFTDSTEAELIPAKVANLECPSVVIEFYEKRLTWLPPPK